MKIIVIGHHSRKPWIDQLQSHFGDWIVTIDYQNRGAYESHRWALELASQQSERCVIMEDDAIPVAGFEQLAQAWFDRMPDALISFYLGTGRPPQWQARVDDCLARANNDYIKLNTLIHGVCYSVPPRFVNRVLSKMHDDLPADFAVGRAWGGQVVYPVESLVEHRDADSVERHADNEARNVPRVARCLAGPLAF